MLCLPIYFCSEKYFVCKFYATFPCRSLCISIPLLWPFSYAIFQLGPRQKNCHKNQADVNSSSRKHTTLIHIPLGHRLNYAEKCLSQLTFHILRHKTWFPFSKSYIAYLYSYALMHLKYFQIFLLTCCNKTLSFLIFISHLCKRQILYLKAGEFGKNLHKC